ncbi:MAG: hypothetical protein ACOCZ5_00670 [bacterium]
MNDIDKIKRHLSPTVQVTITNDNGDEDTFELKPLSMAQQARAFDLSKKFKGMEEGKEDEMMANLDGETIEEIFDLMVSVVKRSIEGIDNETAEEFVNANFLDLFSQFEKLIPKSKELKDQELIKKRKEMSKKNAKKE